MKKIFQKYFRIIILILIILVVFLSPLKKYINPSFFSEVIENAETNPFFPIIFILIYIAGVIFAIPGTILTLTAGPLFGLTLGFVYVVIASNVGCTIAFVLSRFFTKNLKSNRVNKYSKYQSLIDILSKNSFLVMLYIRLIPLFPFNAVNYLSGISKIKYRDYAIASFLGMLPGTFTYVFLSSRIEDIRSDPRRLILPISLLLILTITTYLMKRYKK